MKLSCNKSLNVLLLALFSCLCTNIQSQSCERPNILLIILDDVSWANFSIYGDSILKLPNIEKIAREGVVFDEAYVSTALCTPSRNALLAGRPFYGLEEGAILFGTLPKSIVTYQDVLEGAGYRVGYTGKGADPAFVTPGGRTKNPAGYEYNQILFEEKLEGLSESDYAGNLDMFLKGLVPNEPFSFWVGIEEAHIPYEVGAGQKSGLPCDKIVPPPFLPEESMLQGYLCDYYYEMAFADKQIGAIMQVLEDNGQLENTMVVITSDNGMPVPRAKGGPYELGVHAPLIIRGKGVVPNRRVSDFVVLSDLGPTFVEFANLPPVPGMRFSKSILPILASTQEGRVDASRNYAVVGCEWPTQRAIYTDSLAYIYNFPCCNDTRENPLDGLVLQKNEGWEEQKYTRNTPDHLLKIFRDHPTVRPFYERWRGAKPIHELYHRRNDPYMMDDLAADSATFSQIYTAMNATLLSHLAATEDPALLPKNTLHEHTIYDPKWESQHPNEVAFEKATLMSLGQHWVNQAPSPAAMMAPINFTAQTLTIEGDSISANLTWDHPSNRRAITEYKLYALSADMQVLSLLSTVCATMNKFELRRQLPQGTSFIGIKSSNALGDSDAMVHIMLNP